MAVSRVPNFFLYGLFIVLATRVVTADWDPTIAEEVRQLITTYNENYKVPGLNLAITGVNQTSQEVYIWTEGFGFENIENQTPVSEDTLFFLGSISKSITATVVLKQLHQIFGNAWLQAFDTPIKALVPSYGFMMGDRFRTEQVTFRDLLSHRTCVTTEPFSLNVVAYNASEYYYRQRYAPEVCEFRNGFEYNNALIALAGDIIEHMSGVPFTQLLDDLFLSLGMNDTTYVKMDDSANMPNKAVPYYVYHDQFEVYNYELLKRVIPAIGSGGIISSAKNMKRYMQFHINGGSLDGVEILPYEVHSLSFYSPNALLPIFPEAHGDFYYSTCLFMGFYNGYVSLGHSGHINTFSSLFTMIPGMKIGLFTSASGPGQLQFGQLHQDILNLLTGFEVDGGGSLWRPETPKLKNQAKNKPTHTRIPLKQQNPELLAGHYGNPIAGELDIVLRPSPTNPNAELYMSYGLWGKAWLVLSSNDTNTLTFETEWDPEFEDILQDAIIDSGEADYDISLIFVLDDNNSEVEMLLLSAGGLGALDFYKGQTIDLLPPQPWEDGSC